jgi:hypothetical protein
MQGLFSRAVGWKSIILIAEFSCDLTKGQLNLSVRDGRASALMESQSALWRKFADSLTELCRDAGHRLIVCCSLRVTYRVQPTGPPLDNPNSEMEESLCGVSAS